MKTEKSLITQNIDLLEEELLGETGLLITLRMDGILDEQKFKSVVHLIKKINKLNKGNQVDKRYFDLVTGLYNSLSEIKYRDIQKEYTELSLALIE